MNIRDYIDSQTTFCIGLFGRAGSGKTTLAHTLKAERPEILIFSLDDYFIGDSLYRRRRTEAAVKAVNTLGSHILMTDWWDWDRLFQDIGRIVFSSPSRVIIEGALVPAVHHWKFLDSLFLLYHPNDFRVADLFVRDAIKRNEEELRQRLLITDYAESVSYETMLKSSCVHLHKKLLCLIDREGYRLNNYNIIHNLLESIKSIASVPVIDLKQRLKDV